MFEDIFGDFSFFRSVSHPSRALQVEKSWKFGIFGIPDSGKLRKKMLKKRQNPEFGHFVQALQATPKIEKFWNRPKPTGMNLK